MAEQRFELTFTAEAQVVKAKDRTDLPPAQQDPDDEDGDE